MKFKILKSNPVNQVNLGFDIIDYDTYDNLEVSQVDVISSLKLNNREVRYNIGFDYYNINNNSSFTSEEKEILKGLQSEAAKRVGLEIFGMNKKDVTKADFALPDTFEIPDSTSTHGYKNNIWTEKYGSIVIEKDFSDYIYDTSKIADLILYWQIYSNCFDLISCNYDTAQRRTTPYYIETLEMAEKKELSDDNDKIRAIGKISMMTEDNDIEALVDLLWFLSNKNDRMQGFNKSMTANLLAKELYDFVEGRTREHHKKRAVSEFLSACSLKKSDITKFKANVLVKCADYYGVINANNENIYVTNEGLKLGAGVDSVVEFLLKAANQEYFFEIEKEVNDKLLSGLI